MRPDSTASLTIDVLVKGYTIDGARQLRLDDRVGSIEVGKLANFIVLTDNLFEVDPLEISDLKPSAVFFEGELVSGSIS
ncbi:hypothetical protein ASG95_17710 [Phycicoccus sp. Soil803]|nr:hypothetical protein ASG95_17710 [Phycicoccus sp. Soil803]